MDQYWRVPNPDTLYKILCRHSEQNDGSRIGSADPAPRKWLRSLRLSSLKTQQDPRQISSFCDRGSLKNQQKSTTPWRYRLRISLGKQSERVVWVTDTSVNQPQCFMLQFSPKRLCTTLCSLKTQSIHVRIPRLSLKWTAVWTDQNQQLRFSDSQTR